MSPQNSSIDKYQEIHITFVIILLVILAFYPLLNTGFTTNDDMGFSLKANSKSNLIDTVIFEAKNQGRLFCPINYFILFIPYLIDSFIYYKFISLGSTILAIILFGYVVKLFLKSYHFSLLIIIFFLATLQNAWDHFPLTSYPLLYSSSIILFMISLILLHRYIETLKKRYHILSSIIFFFSFLYNESLFLLYSLVIVCLSIFSVKSAEVCKKNSFIKIKHMLFPYALNVCLYLACYIVFRFYYPSNYEGTKVEGFLFTSFLKVVYKYSIASLPTYIYFHYGKLLNAFSTGYAGHKYSLLYTLQNARVEWIVKSLIVSYLFYRILHSKSIIFSNKKYLGIACISVIIFFIPESVVGLVRKYQIWVERGSVAYVFTYFSFFGTVLFFVAAICYLNQLTLNKKIISNLYILLLTTGIALVSITTDYLNFHVALSQAQSHLKWKTIDYFLGSEDFKAIPDDSLIYAPSLWDSIGLAKPHETYWREYVKTKSGKNIHIIRDINKEKLINFDIDKCKNILKNNIYFLKYSQEKKDPNQFIVFAKINNLKLDDRVYFYSDNAILFTYSKYRKLLLFFNMIEDDKLKEVSVDNFCALIKNNFFRCVINKEAHKDPFVKTVISSKDIDLESISLSNYVDDYVSPGHVLSFIWGKGFSCLEGSVLNNWRWCSPEGRLVIKNGSKSSIRTTLEMSFTTGYEEFSNLIVDSPIFTEKLKINKNGVFFSKTIIIPPGKQTIRFICDAKQVYSPRDTRPLIFRVCDFKLKDVNILPGHLTELLE